MITPEEWMQASEPAQPLAPALTAAIVRKIQSDALWHAARKINDMSRGTKSEDRSAAIDEARDLVASLARNDDCVNKSA